VDEAIAYSSTTFLIGEERQLSTCIVCIGVFREDKDVSSLRWSLKFIDEEMMV